MNAAYYNEIDPFAAQWLRELIKNNLIAPGEVDERSIDDVKPDDLKPFTQHHFFAGIGVWSYALRRAGWEDTRPIWTMSCPCQPFSAAGAGDGFNDKRHLWPAAFHLISQCRPAIIFGEQVASKIAGPWIDLVHTDLEALDYAFGCVPFPSAGVGAPHIRDRAYWMTYSDSQQLYRSRHVGTTGRNESTDGRNSSGMANTDCTRLEGRKGESKRTPKLATRTSSVAVKRPSPTNGLWRDADWLLCRDGKWRPVEPGTFPLADGSAARVGRLRGYGNAINAEAATTFITAALETINE